jgi:oligoendopeptidase F
MSEILTKNGYELSAWDLTDLLPEPCEEIASRRLAALAAAVDGFAGCRERLSPRISPAELVDILHRYAALVEEIRVLSSHGTLWVSADTRSRQAQGHRGRIQQALTGLHNRILFVEIWWKSLAAAEAEALLSAAELWGDYRYFLERLRQTTPYTLDERSEQIVNRKDASGSKFLVTLWSMLNNRLQFELALPGQPEGERQTLSRPEVMSYVFSSQAELRAAAYRELGQVYEREAPVLGQIYITLMRDWYWEKVELRGYPSPIAVRNVANDLPDEAVDVLLQVVRENVSLFHRYFRLKARWLGVARLHRNDLYAPLTTAERQIPYGDAVATVLDTFACFSPVFAGNAERVFAERHVDSRPNSGKWSGDFCSTVVPRLTPWVLVNYTGRTSDVLNLGHELGHAIHNLLASGHSVLTQQPSLALGETASVFCETLVADRLLAEENDPEVRRELLAISLDRIYATVQRQAYMVLFELAAHEAIRKGASLDELGRLYQANLAEQFGESVVLTDDFRYEWLGMHQIFHSPFYCYAYSFGQLLTLALYRRYQDEGESFKDGYLKLLAYGGSARPQEILEEAGIDMLASDFWQGGYRVIADRISELEALEG